MARDGFAGHLRDLLITSQEPVFRPETGWLMLCIVLGMAFAPKIATVVSVLARRSRRAAFGGTLRFIASVLFAMLTASPVLGLAMARWRMAAIPEEATPPQALLSLNLSALSVRRVTSCSLTSST